MSPSLEELVLWIEQHFACHDGPFMAYVKHEGRDEYYHTLAIGCKADPKFNCPDLLRNALQYDLICVLEDFKSRGIDKPILYWRYAPEERIQEEQSPEDPSLFKIRTRVAIPDADWSKIRSDKPEGEPCVRVP